MFVGLLAPAVAMTAVVLKAQATASGAQRPPAVGEVPAGARPATPLLSFRRTPDLLALDLRGELFAKSLLTVTSAVKDQACFAAGVNGTMLVSDNPDKPFIPASNMKIITAAVALDALGPDFRYTTEVRGSVAAGGSVQRLVLVGGGDPVLSTEGYSTSKLNKYPPTITTSLEELADAVAAAGVKAITNLVADESRYDSVRDAPSWGDAIAEYNASNLSALMVNDGYTSTKKRVRPDNSALGALQVFRSLLEDRGITVELMAEGRADGAPVIATVQSAPLSDIVGEMLTTSDNVTAELMLKEIGRAVAANGSTVAGAGVVKERLASWDIDTTGLVFADGSGLSTDDRLTCRAFVDVLDHVGASGPVFDGLPIAGKTGTLRGYFQGTAGAGKLRAKTGTLNTARSLTGFYPGQDGSWIEFSFLVNGAGAKGRAENLWDDIVRAFALYPQGPAPADLGPAPVVAG